MPGERLHRPERLGARALLGAASRSAVFISWSTTIPGRFPALLTASNGLDHRIFATYTTGFCVTLIRPRKVFDPGYNVIDATLLVRRPHTLIFKDERETPLEKHILNDPSAQRTTGPGASRREASRRRGLKVRLSLEVNGGTLVYYDHYRKPPQHYGAIFSTATDPEWHDVTSQIDFPAGLRHWPFPRHQRSRIQTLWSPST